MIGNGANNQIISDVIYLASAGAQGKTIENRNFNWRDILVCAYEQDVASLIACVLMRDDLAECPQAISDSLIFQMKCNASANLIRQQRIFHLLSELEANSIEALIIKGSAISKYYAYPEARGSVDTDLLIQKCSEKQLYRFLRKKGFDVFPRRMTSHHGIAQHKKYGKIEIHTQLYDEIVEQVWFQFGANEKLLLEQPIRVTTGNDVFMTLGPTDHLIFLTLHMVKHFIGSGLSIKMLIDIALHYQNYKDQIDADRYWSVLKQLHYTTLVASILGIMIDTSFFHVEDFPGLRCEYMTEKNSILTDLFAGGYLGEKECDSRHEGAMEYNRQLLLKNMTPAQYKRFMLSWKFRTGFAGLFPATEILLHQYPFAKEKPYLLPFLRVYHVPAFICDKLKSGVLKRQIRTSTSAMPQESRKRVELFRKLNML